MHENGSAWEWGEQTHGFYPVNIWYNGSNLATTTLEARTPTKSTYPTHTGTGEANFQWGWADYHPVDASDWLGGDDGSDNIIPNQRWFGNDLNTYSTTVQSRMNAWGVWLTNTIGFDGYRLDFVRGFQVDYVSAWINNLPKIGTNQRWIVGEYWTENRARLKQWVDANAAKGAAVNVFDFPLRATLKNMCSGSGSSFNMAWLNHSGMIRADDGNAVSGTRVSTFLDNHDNAKNSHQWITKDWKLGYGYILTHEGRPCVLYNHFYAVPEQDWENSNPSNSVTPPTSLKDDIKKLMFIRKTYLGGSLTVLSEVGNPYPSGDTYNVYVARRAGNGTKSGAIVVLNNHDTQTKGLWVSTSPSGWSNWANLWLKNALNSTERTQVQADGRVYVQAPARGYAVYVLESEYVSYSLKSGNVVEDITGNGELTEGIASVDVFPNPVETNAEIKVVLSKESDVNIAIYNSLGQEVTSVFKGKLPMGEKSFNWDKGFAKPGTYYVKVITNENTIVKTIVINK
jgi:alpha-amylase